MVLLIKEFENDSKGNFRTISFTFKEKPWAKQSADLGNCLQEENGEKERGKDMPSMSQHVGQPLDRQPALRQGGKLSGESEEVPQKQITNLKVWPASKRKREQRRKKGKLPISFNVL